MCACAGSLIERVGETAPYAKVRFHPVCRDIRARENESFEKFAGTGPRGTAAWQDWVYEHAEAGGKPSAAHEVHGERSAPGTVSAKQRRTAARCAAATVCKSSACGSPQRTLCLARALQDAPRNAALSGRPARGFWPVFLLCIPHSCLFPAFSPAPAADPDMCSLPGGKVRWQKRYAYPARRTKRGLRFLKTISSQKLLRARKRVHPGGVDL